MTTTECPWCEGLCTGVDLTGLLNPHLHWLWEQLAVTADRKGDPHLTTGGTKITMPAPPAHRAAVIGLLDVAQPRAAREYRIDLMTLTANLQDRYPGITPGALAAHTVRRRLGAAAQQRAEQRASRDQLLQHAVAAFQALPAAAPWHPDITALWPALNRRKLISRLLKRSDGDILISQAVAVIAGLPREEHRRDRRRLAESVTQSPHALDHGTLPALVLAILKEAGAIPADKRNRAAWAHVGIDCDDLTGGLTTLGFFPQGWTLPRNATLTITPRELARCTWPPPPHADAWVFVTENPSVSTAAADIADIQPEDATPIRLLCTVGTPSALEIGAIARIATAGWNIAVRADFDQAGLNHVAAILAGVPEAVAWRMGAYDYLSSLNETSDEENSPGQRALPDTPWDPRLKQVMSERKIAAYEESITDDLLRDLTNARPST